MEKFNVYFWKNMPRGMFKEIREKNKDRLKDYMKVYICEDFEEMYELVDKIECDNLERDYAGRTLCYNRNLYSVEDNSFIKTSPCCGHIVLNKKYFYMDSVSHECTHAVIGYFSRKLKDLTNIFTKVDEIGNIIDDEDYCEDYEELFCYMVGGISDQIVSKHNNNKKLTSENKCDILEEK